MIPAHTTDHPIDLRDILRDLWIARTLALHVVIEV